VQLYIKHLQQCDARWALPDLAGKDGRVRTVTVPDGVKTRIDLWTAAAGISSGPLFRPVTKGGAVQGRGLQDEKAIWPIVVRYARETELGQLAPHDRSMRLRCL
jgi:integrase/recombinase XerD